jgi:hypothetical protein
VEEQKNIAAAAIAAAAAHIMPRAIQCCRGATQIFSHDAVHYVQCTGQFYGLNRAAKLQLVFFLSLESWILLFTGTVHTVGVL